MLRASSLLLSAVLVLSVSAVSYAQTEQECSAIAGNYTLWPPADSFKLARALHGCLDSAYPTDLRNLLIHARDSLPESVRNAVFRKVVCLYNVDKSEYLYSPSRYEYEDGGYDPPERRVFTWIPRSIEGKWNLIHKEDNKFYITPTDSGEYLTARVQMFDGDVNRRQAAMTTVANIGGVFPTLQNPRAEWALEPLGDYFCIRNVHYNEYFYAIYGFGFDGNRRSVGTWKGTEFRCAQDPSFQWKLEGC